MAVSEGKSKVWLLYLKHMRGDRGRLSLNILREISGFLNLPGLVDVSPAALRYFDFQTCTWAQSLPLITAILVDNRSIWVILEDSRVFCCGGDGEAGRKTYLLARGGAVEQKALMNCARCDHGLLALHSHAFAFGGRGNITCEDFQPDQWTPLPNMRESRWHFNPCVFGSLIYLCGCGSSVMEVFSPLANTFLPPILVPENSSRGCCLYVDNDLLVLHQGRCIVKYAAGQAGQLEKRSEVNTPEVWKYQNSQPVVNKASGCFYMVYGGACMWYGMSSGEVVGCIE